MKKKLTVEEALKRLKEDYIPDGYNEEEKVKIRELKQKYPDIYIPEIDADTNLPIIPNELSNDWEY